jgi:eukaryotic-like serine/threonine-protein kinase
MPTDFTQAQDRDEQLRAIRLSQQRTQPPVDVPGYEPQRFLGAGAYGEVWVAIDRTTGRHVAIKFYLHRGGLDWSLLSHEVEKLALLSADRYVVQLLDVGWESDPPYYVMEYVENGSLADRLEKPDSLPVGEATTLFREIAVGLMHAHSKGVLHCDLKPANVLLDQDGKPRLADFGQSRLSHDQTPALGTLFYMAPEQARPDAVPDARWDVYALGAIFYFMLTGKPPYRNAWSASEVDAGRDLEQRLALYRRLINKSLPPDDHRHISGVDRQLAEIIDRCLAIKPEQRYPTVQAVLDALNTRERARARRPLVVLGALGPLLLLLVVSGLAWLWFSTSLERSRQSLTEGALEGLRFFAESIAGSAGKDLEMRFRDVEDVALDPSTIDALANLESDAKTGRILEALSDPKQSAQDFNELREKLRRAPQAELLEERLKRFNKLVTAKTKVELSSWFITDAFGNQVARWPASETLGKNYARRTYFHGGKFDLDVGSRPDEGEHIKETQLSAIYRSDSSHLWVVSISSPVFQAGSDGAKKFLGVVAMSFRVGSKFISLPPPGTERSNDGSRPFAVLIDARAGKYPGSILQHPLFDQVDAAEGEVPNRLLDYSIKLEELSALSDAHGDADFKDPLAADKQGKPYRQRYLAAVAAVNVRDVPTGWVVLVEESYDQAIGAALADLSTRLLEIALAGLVVMALVIMGLWWLVIRMSKEPAGWRPSAVANGAAIGDTPASIGSGKM